MRPTVPLSSVTRELRERFAKFRCVLIDELLSQPLVTRWRNEAARMAAQHARTIERIQDGHVLSYRVVTGDTVQQAWPELWDFYAAPQMLQWIAEITGEPRIYTSGQFQSAINLNVLEQSGDVYRWHFDAVPYTLILFLTDTPEAAGGVLEMWPNSRAAVEAGVQDPPRDELVRVTASSGTAVLMDGSVCYHHVTEMTRPYLRLTVPMVYPATQQHSRPNELDSYLYGAAHKE